MASRKYGPSVFEKMQEVNARRFEREAKKRGLTVEQYSALRSLMFWVAVAFAVILVLYIIPAFLGCVSS